ncbi:MAG: isoprenylcysteine carboxylmethyltransferase family protein [Acidobacteriaceae bacterium]|nr:isoprenylcysteine carboxylmethyltransferase family protein [Acidobacteriaceae bacterium]
MFKATNFEYRNRYIIHVILFVLGFMAPWGRLWPRHGQRTWAALTMLPVEHGGMPILAATLAVTALGLLLVVLGAVLRTWGTAYIGADVVNSRGMHGGAVVADGPYRHMRNPLYVGSWLHMLAVALLMEPAGAIFTMVLGGLLQLRLIGSEEPFLTQKLGADYTAYCARVPRLLPSIVAKVPAAGHTPHWGYAVLCEIYFIGVAVSYAVLFALYGSMLFPVHILLLVQCILASLGVSLIGDAFNKKLKAAE